MADVSVGQLVLSFVDSINDITSWHPVPLSVPSGAGSNVIAYELWLWNGHDDDAVNIAIIKLAIAVYC